MLNVVYAKCHKIGLSSERQYDECRYAECSGAPTCAVQCKEPTVSVDVKVIARL
jgi:hypothetical protein